MSKKKITRRRRGNPLMRFTIYGVFVYLLITCNNLGIQYYKSKTELTKIQTEIKQTKLEIEETKNRIEKGVRKEMIEQAARERFGYAYPNETIYIDISGN